MSERDLLSAYLDDECTAEERALVDERLARDESWRTELDGVRAARRAVRELPWREPPPGFVAALLEDAPGTRVAKLRRRVALAGSAMGTAAAAIVAALLVAGGSQGDVAPAVATLAGVAGASDSTITPVSAPIDLERAAQKYDIRRKVLVGTTVDEVRRDGRLIARVYAKDAADGSLRVEMFDEAGNVLSRTVPSGPVATTLGESALVDWDVHDPRTAGDNFTLVQRRVHEGGIVELSYSDGVLSVTILEQHGELDWDDVPEGGVPAELAGVTARRYTTRHGDVWVFERDNVVYTCVGRAPADELAGLAAEIAG